MSQRDDSLRTRLGAITRGAFARSRLHGAVARRPDGDMTTPDDALVEKTRLLERLVDEMGERRFEEGEEAVAAAIREFVARVLDEEDVALNEAERDRLAEELTAETLGLGPLAPLMVDPAVTDILVNGPDDVYVERHGRLEPADIRFRDEEHVVRLIERMAARVGRRIDVASPMLDARLPDGSRLNATLPPVSPDGPTLSIRRFAGRRLRMDDLLRLGELSPDMRRFLDVVVRERANLLVSGGTGAGKSTLLGALCEAVSSNERLVTIEDTAELVLQQDHVVRLETRPPNVEGSGAVGARELVINALRMRPDRIIVGEVRGGEALDMLQAMNTGHDGSLCTLHANSPQRRSRPARDDGPDGGSGTAFARDPRADRQRDPVHRPRAALRGRRAPDRVHRGAGRARDRHAAAERDLPVPPDRAGPAASRGELPGDRRRAALRGDPAKHARAGHSDQVVPPAGRRRGGVMEWIVASAVVLGIVVAALAVRRLRIREHVRVRLHQGEPPAPPPPPRSSGRAARLGVVLLSVAIGVGAGIAVLFATDWGAPIAVAFGLLLGVLTAMVVSLVVGARASRLQLELANAIDLMVSSLQAGAGLMDSLHAAERDAPTGLRRRLEAMTLRIRIGERPSHVCRELARGSELESFRLFYSALAVQWESGSSLAPVLSDVGRFVRDQLEIIRRIRAQTAEVRLSVIGILGLTGLIALLMWQAYPDRFDGFLSTELGRGAAAATVALQALGVSWIYRTSRIRY